MSEQVPQESSPPAARAEARAPARRGGFVAAIALLLAAAAAGLAGWQWYDAQLARTGLEQDLARRLSEIDARARDARSVSEQARGSLRDLEARMGQLEARLLETQSQRYALEALYQELSRSRDEWVLAEVEQILLLASQQLQHAAAAATGRTHVMAFPSFAGCHASSIHPRDRATLRNSMISLARACALD